MRKECDSVQFEVRAHCPKEAGELCKGSGRPFRYVRTGREKEAEGPSARS
jgi:hypothetical protein